MWHGNKSTITFFLTQPTSEEESECKAEWLKVSQMSDEQRYAYIDSWRDENGDMRWHSELSNVPPIYRKLASSPQVQNAGHSYGTWFRSLQLALRYMKANPDFDALADTYIRTHALPEIEDMF